MTYSITLGLTDVVEAFVAPYHVQLGDTLAAFFELFFLSFLFEFDSFQG
jgi:hypothetical protein